MIGERPLFASSIPEIVHGTEAAWRKKKRKIKEERKKKIYGTARCRESADTPAVCVPRILSLSNFRNLSRRNISPGALLTSSSPFFAGNSGHVYVLSSSGPRVRRLASPLKNACIHRS